MTTPRVPYIPLFKVFMPRSVLAPLRRTLFSGYIGEGPRVAEFEAALRPWFGARHVLALNSGNRTKTARDLGVDPRTIFRHLEKEEKASR